MCAIDTPHSNSNAKETCNTAASRRGAIMPASTRGFGRKKLQHTRGQRGNACQSRQRSTAIAYTSGQRLSQPTANYMVPKSSAKANNDAAAKLQIDTTSWSCSDPPYLRNRSCLGGETSSGGVVVTPIPRGQPLRDCIYMCIFSKN